MSVERALVSGYVRRFGGWTALCEALARALGVQASDIIDVDADGDPVAFLSARTQHGAFAMVFEAFIDQARAPRFAGKDRLVRELARELGEDVLYDDGASNVPTRWVLVRPDGARFEVFERSDGDGVALVLDAAPPRRLLDEPT